jgi:tubulin-specific chaperone A
MAPPSKLAVATLAVRRLVKEEASYHKEQERQEESIKKLEADQSDENAEYLLKQEVEHLILSWQSPNSDLRLASWA